MARARLIKPGFFTNDELPDIPFEYRLLFIGLWTLADREGRLEDRARKIKGELFPHDVIDVEKGLALLAGRGFLERYEVDGARYLHVKAFTKHQSPNVREPASTIPAPYQHRTGTILSDSENPETDRYHTGTIPERYENGTGTPVAVAVAVAVPVSSDGSGSGSGDPAAAGAERELLDFWTHATGTTVPALQAEQMLAAVERLGPQWVKDAIHETAANGSKSWKYTAAILDRWERQGRDTNARRPNPTSAGARRADEAARSGKPHVLDILRANGRLTEEALPGELPGAAGA